MESGNQGGLNFFLPSVDEFAQSAGQNRTEWIVGGLDNDAGKGASQSLVIL